MPLHDVTKDGHAKIDTAPIRGEIWISTQWPNTSILRGGQKGCEATVMLLAAKGARVDAEGKEGYSLLELAVFGDHIAIAQVLLAKDADINGEESHGEHN
jgi:ankyrin repeat protein